MVQEKTVVPVSHPWRWIFLLGAVLFVLAIPVWIIWLAPECKKIPDNFTYKSDILSIDNFYYENLKKFKGVQWDVFSKHNKEVIKEANITIQPINNEAFIKSLATCTGVLCGAGFETPAEALFLKKKLLVIPMKTQYEQQCNAAAFRQWGYL